MKDYDKLLDANKERLIELAKKQSKYNEKGQCLITKEDDDVGDEHDIYD